MKTSRNAPCPCGSGQKYKKCCLLKEEHQSKQPPQPVADEPVEAYYDDDNLDELSNSVVDLVQANKLDEAEAACERLLKEFPDCPDGYMRFIAVHEARGNYSLAADYADKTVAHIKAHEGYFADEMLESFIQEAAALRKRAEGA